MKHIFSKPNQITYMRIILIPVFVIFLLVEIPYHNYIAAFIFAILSLSDALDGFIARRTKQVTEIGKILDPIADKLLISVALIFLVGRGVPVWMAIIIIAREWLITILRFIVIPKHVIPASKLGKIKIITQIVAILAVIINFPFNWYFMLIAVIITVVSGLDQILKIRNILDEKILNLPNIITFMRFALLPLFAFTMINSKLNYSLIIFGVIVLSDRFDGISARITNQMTEFGRAFDTFNGEEEIKKLLKETHLHHRFQMGLKSQTYTQPTFHPSRRLDYILTSKRIKVRNYKVLNLHFSDHLPLLVDFKVI